MMSLDANEDAVVGTLKQSLVILLISLVILTIVFYFFIYIVFVLQRQLETLGAQRAGLEDMLKDMKRKVCLIMFFF